MFHPLKSVQCHLSPFPCQETHLNPIPGLSNIKLANKYGNTEVPATFKGRAHNVGDMAIRRKPLNE